jgi:biotin carboxylase
MTEPKDAVLAHARDALGVVRSDEPPVVVVGCGFPQMGLLRAFRSRNVATVGLDRSADAVGVSLATRFMPVSTADVDAVIAAVKAVGARGIATSGSELALTTTVKVADELGLPFYADHATVRRAQVKDEMRRAYELAGLPVPRFASVHDVIEARAFVERVGLPLVVKPANGWGQRGVARIDHLDELPARVEEAIAQSFGGGGAVLEEVLVGPELSVNGWIEDGELVAHCVTDREVFPGSMPLGVMRSEVYPSRLDPAAVDAAVRAARAAARALGLGAGPCYSQVCVTARGPVLFETAARCGGGFDAEITRLVSGVDFYDRLVDVALGITPRFDVRGPTHGAALVRFLAPPVGTVKSVDGIAGVTWKEGVVDASIYARPGQRLAGLVNAAARVGHVLVFGDSREQAVARADEAEAGLRIELALTSTARRWLSPSPRRRIKHAARAPQVPRWRAAAGGRGFPRPCRSTPSSATRSARPR